MIKRIVDVSHQSWIFLKNRQLCIEQGREQVASIPVEDLGVLILAHPAIGLTQAAIVACQENNAVLVFCDGRHLPYSILLPLSEGHSLHQKILHQQIAVSKPTKKRIWQQIIREKIRQQVLTLEKSGQSNTNLVRLIGEVRSGDPKNVEAQAAQRYWRMLFGNNFRRDQGLEGINALLNYGYAVMRALIARAVVGAGLHPALGVHHTNQYNGLCLVDDLMEPLRPWVDAIVWQLAKTNHGDLSVNPETKRQILELLTTTVLWDGKGQPLMAASHHYANSLKRVYEEPSLKMKFMQWKESLVSP